MSLPDFIEPQLAQLVESPPPGRNWIYEVKYDGYRMGARLKGTDVRFYSRNRNDWSTKLRDLVKRMGALKLGTGWLDGEIVVFDELGRTNFQQLQNAMDRSVSSQVRFVVFDVPYWDGRDLRALPLSERMAMLDKILAKVPDNSTVVRSEVLDLGNDVATVWDQACELGLEGLIGKRADAPYKSGRSAGWIKLKCRPRQEFVIGGWTSPGGTRAGFGALLVGVREGRKLVYAGRVGTGYSSSTISMLMPKLRALASDTCPFTTVPSGRDRWSRGERPTAFWVRPELVAEVAYATWTTDRLLRQASFIALREDKPARQVKREASR